MSGVSLPEYKSVIRWTVQDVVNWLQESGFVDCSKIFRDAGIDGNKFVNLTENELSRINCPQKFRKGILYHIESISDKPERERFSKPLPTERDRFIKPSPVKQTPTRSPALPSAQALPPKRPPIALPPQGNKYQRNNDVDDDDGWGSEEFDSESGSEEGFEIGGQVNKNEGGDSDYESPDEKGFPARPHGKPVGQQPMSSPRPGPRRAAPPPPEEDEFYEDPDAPKPNVSVLHGGPLPPIPAIAKLVPAFPPAPQSPKVPHRPRPKSPVLETEETYEDPDAKPTLIKGTQLPRPPPKEPEVYEDPNIQTQSAPKKSGPPPASQMKTQAKRPPPTPQEPEVYEDPNVQTQSAPKNSGPPPGSQIKTPQLPARRPPPTPQEPEDYENTEEAVQNLQPRKKLPPPPPSTSGSNQMDDEYMEMEEKTRRSQPAPDNDDSDADYLDPDPKVKTDPKTKKPGMIPVLPKLEPTKPTETKLPPLRKQLPPPPTADVPKDPDPDQLPQAPPVPKPPPIPSQPVTSSQSMGSTNEEEEELKTKPWYHGASTRQEVEPKLNQLKTNGMYCVRQSAGKPNQPYTLVVFCEDRIFNLPIRLRNDRKYALGGEKTDEVAFGSIVELVRFFRRNYLILNGKKGQQTQLKKPLPK